MDVQQIQALVTAARGIATAVQEQNANMVAQIQAITELTSAINALAAAASTTTADSDKVLTQQPSISNKRKDKVVHYSAENTVAKANKRPRTTNANQNKDPSPTYQEDTNCLEKELTPFELKAAAMEISSKNTLTPAEKKARTDSLHEAAMAVFQSRMDNPQRPGRPPNKKVNELLAKLISEGVPYVTKTDIVNAERRLFAHGKTPEQTALDALAKGLTSVQPNTKPQAKAVKPPPPKKPPGRPKGSTKAAKAAYKAALQQCKVDIVTAIAVKQQAAKEQGTRLSPGTLSAVIAEKTALWGVNPDDINAETMRNRIGRKILHKVLHPGPLSRQERESLLLADEASATTHNNGDEEEGTLYAQHLLNEKRVKCHTTSMVSGRSTY